MTAALTVACQESKVEHQVVPWLGKSEVDYLLEPRHLDACHHTFTYKDFLQM